MLCGMLIFDKNQEVATWFRWFFDNFNLAQQNGPPVVPAQSQARWRGPPTCFHLRLSQDAATKLERLKDFKDSKCMLSCIGSACNKVLCLQGIYCHHHSAGAQRRSDAVRDTSLHPNVSRRHPNSVEVGLRWFAPSRTLHGSFAECCTGHHPSPDKSDSKSRIVSSCRLNIQIFKMGEFFWVQVL